MTRRCAAEGMSIEEPRARSRSSSLHRTLDRALAAAVGDRILPAVDRYVAGPPTSHGLRRRIRRLEIPGATPVAPRDRRERRFRVPLTKVTTPLGFSFDPGGWHPYVATLAMLEDGQLLDPIKTPLFEYYRRFTPRTVQEALLEDVEAPLDPLGSWPIRGGLLSVWALTRRSVERALREAQPRTRQFIGPQDDARVGEDVHRLWRVLDSIRAGGYRPDEHPGRPISGYFLVSDDDFRFVCRHGNHRLAALTTLGYAEVDVRIAEGIPPLVGSRDLAWWTTERGGLLPEDVAHRLFSKLFNETGRQKAQNVGLLPA